MKALLLVLCFMTLANQRVGADEIQVRAEDVLDRIQYFDVAAGALDVALLEYSKQARLEVSTDGELLRRFRTEGIKGRESARAALQKLLSDSGLTFRVVGNVVQVIRPAG
jgi:hypothetical protein